MPTDDDSIALYRISIHEAAHAVAMVAFGIGLNWVCIEPQELANGDIAEGTTDGEIIRVTRYAGKGEEIAMPFLIHLLVSRVAEGIVNPHVSEDGRHQHDVQVARGLATLAVCGSTTIVDGVEVVNLIEPAELARDQPRIQALLEAACWASLRFVQDNWTAIEAVADRLMERRKISGDEVATIVAKISTQDDRK
jgi:hypothetical protein